MFDIIKKSSYVWFPIIAGIIGFFMLKYNIVAASDSNRSSIANISGVLAGFLFTGYAIFLSLPSDNNFFSLLKKHGYSRLFYRQITIAIILNAITMVISLLNCRTSIPLVVFFAGLGNTAGAFYILARAVSHLHKS